MQNTRLRAITTRYRGFALRSRLEARWSVFFDHLGIKWDYEPEGFELGNGMRYLPDFWLPEWRIWVEVKPATVSDPVSEEKAHRLAKLSRCPVYITNGLPDGVGRLFYHCDREVRTTRARAAWAGATVEGPGLFFATFDQPDITGDYLEHDHGDDITLQSDGVQEDYPAPGRADEFYSALEAARGARFEFGEKGAL